MSKTANSLLLMIAALGMAASAQGQSASGTVNAMLQNRSGIGIVFNSNPSGVTLAGNGTSNASLNFGAVSMYMISPPPGVAHTRTATDFTVSTPFDVYVEASGVNSPSYRLQATLQSVPGLYTFRIDAITLSTTAATIAAADPNYNANVQHTFYLTIPRTAPAGAVSNTVNFVVTAN